MYDTNLKHDDSKNQLPFYFKEDYVCIKMKYSDYKAYEEYLDKIFSA